MLTILPDDQIFKEDLGCCSVSRKVGRYNLALASAKDTLPDCIVVAVANPTLEKLCEIGVQVSQVGYGGVLTGLVRFMQQSGRLISVQQCHEFVPGVDSLRDAHRLPHRPANNLVQKQFQRNHQTQAVLASFNTGEIAAPSSVCGGRAKVIIEVVGCRHHARSPLSGYRMCYAALAQSHHACNPVTPATRSLAQQHPLDAWASIIQATDWVFGQDQNQSAWLACLRSQSVCLRQDLYPLCCTWVLINNEKKHHA